MRALASVLVAALILGGIYYAHLRKMPTAAEGTAATQSISLVGVQNDLLQIARAERAYIVEHDGCGSLQELLSSGALSMARTERDGYTYTVDCSAANFTVRAQHPPAPEGSSIRFPGFAVDQTLQVREAD